MEFNLNEYTLADMDTDFQRYYDFLNFCDGISQCSDKCFESLPFEMFLQWLESYPTWTKGFLSPQSAEWLPEYQSMPMPMNILLVGFCGLENAHKYVDEKWLRNWMDSQGWSN